MTFLFDFARQNFSQKIRVECNSTAMWLSTLIELNSVRVLTKSVHAVTIESERNLAHPFPFIEFGPIGQSPKSPTSWDRLSLPPRKLLDKPSRLKLLHQVPNDDSIEARRARLRPIPRTAWEKKWNKGRRGKIGGRVDRPRWELKRVECSWFELIGRAVDTGSFAARSKWP